MIVAGLYDGNIAVYNLQVNNGIKKRRQSITVDAPKNIEYMQKEILILRILKLKLRVKWTWTRCFHVKAFGLLITILGVF